MTTAAAARAVVRSRIENGAVVDSQARAVTLRWPNEFGEPIPDEAPFLYTEFITDRGSIASFGGGSSNNRYRYPARIECFAFVPMGRGLSEAESIAEQVAVLFRSYRDNDISCFDATVMAGGNGSDLKPPGLESIVGNYFYAACEVSLFFDQIG
jgi:hypothetical protein